MTRETAINLLDDLIGMVEDNQQNDYDEAFKMAIRSLKSWDEDVTPVVHGEWCMSNDPLRISQYQWYCSNCHSEELYEYKYCPNCGARMDGEV